MHHNIKIVPPNPYIKPEQYAKKLSWLFGKSYASENIKIEDIDDRLQISGGIWKCGAINKLQRIQHSHIFDIAMNNDSLMYACYAHNIVAHHAAIRKSLIHSMDSDYYGDIMGCTILNLAVSETAIQNSTIMNFVPSKYATSDTIDCKIYNIDFRNCDYYDMYRSNIIDW